MVGSPDWHVVRNAEEQYSIWRAAQPVPAGWDIVSTFATKNECLDHISQVWTDIRPASAR
ncbi:antibiotic synthesis protein MbtH [Actinoplanes capillaceus]|uniref:Antibiotic synthesis protein MbtH n=1 Tax=Actinoplanes campanulatus TaxID=113559 RepID=A0ABQ3WUL6_9ACTN|nr:MbtH family NRPS accessory protein [Actinoplanes capillaceus]GID49981.1 antibiotic synthesis protein MbtH [Actinoplanes capillaceus]